MKYAEWEKTVPPRIRQDPLWHIEAYRLALFITDLSWRDVTRLMRDRRTRDVAVSLSRSLSAIGANLAVLYSRSELDERRRAYEQAVCAVAESREWYARSRQVLGEMVAWHRVTLLTQLERLMRAGPQQAESAVNRETLEMLLENVYLP